MSKDEILDKCDTLYWATEDPDEGGQGMDAGDALEEIHNLLQQLR